MRTTSRDWRATLLPALFISAITACCGVLLIAQPSPRDFAFAAQFSTFPSHQWTVATPDTDGDPSDDSSDNDDAPDGLLAAAPITLTADSGETRLFTPYFNRSFSFALDGHSLRSPPQ